MASREVGLYRTAVVLSVLVRLAGVVAVTLVAQWWYAHYGATHLPGPHRHVHRALTIATWLVSCATILVLRSGNSLRVLTNALIVLDCVLLGIFLSGYSVDQGTAAVERAWFAGGALGGVVGSFLVMLRSERESV